jgi:glycosyltransferase involved in cell wall biosynthesis
MKVLVLAPPMGATGGIQRYTETLVRALRETLTEKNVRLLAVSAEPESGPNGTTALRPGVKLRFFLSAVAMAFRWRPRLILCTHIGVAPIARIIQRLIGAPYWVVIHGIEIWGELSPPKLRALRGAQRLVTNSRFTIQAASARHGLSRCKVSILAPAFSSAPLQIDSTPLEAPAGLLHPVVLTVGRLAASERYKGHDVMAEAWPMVLQEVATAQYVIVGDGDDRPRLEARVRELVFFKGTVTGDDLHACYEDCSVFALPARTILDAHPPQGEGFGIVFLEAMSHGKPVIGPSTGAPAEFIHSGEHGLLVDPANPEKVAQALVELLLDPDRARRMGCAAREWVNEQFSYEMFCRRLREMLTSK